jgi:site-specific recombinase XerC
MINRMNYRHVKAFLAYERDIRQLTPKTVNRNWGHLRHLLEWADETPLGHVTKRVPTFPAYLAADGRRNDGRPGKLSNSMIAGTCRIVRAFYEWAKKAYPARYAEVDEQWLETIRPVRLQGSVQERELYTLEDIRAICALEPECLCDERDIAAVAFMLLSGIRVGAFVTMPIKAVDIGARTVKQWPALGVETKNSKAATTYLLEIPDLLETVASWDRRVRADLSPEALWYAKLSKDGERLVERTVGNAGRRELVARGLARLCARANIAYHSPHKLRHGHAVYAMGNATTIADFKAVSQNLMHASLGITDRVYGVLQGDDVRTRIGALGGNNTAESAISVAGDQAAIVAQIQALLTQLEGG